MGYDNLKERRRLSRVKQRSLRQQKFVEVGVRRNSSLRQPMTHPARPSEIAAGTSASRSSPTEADVWTACLRVWRY